MLRFTEIINADVIFVHYFTDKQQASDLLDAYMTNCINQKTEFNVCMIPDETLILDMHCISEYFRISVTYTEQEIIVECNDFDEEFVI